MQIDQSYAANRNNFRDAADRSGARLKSIPHISGNDLYTDIALLGDETAKHVVVITSGLHGVELPAGSLAQQILMSKLRPEHLKDTRYVLVHALNPYGAAHALRTDMDDQGGRNIDPARNFINFETFDRTLFQADLRIASAFDRAELSSGSLTTMWARLLYTAFVEQGQNEFKRQFVRGQYSNPILPYYGGGRPSCTRLTWEKIIEEDIFKPHVETITHFDVHTGDGPFGGLQHYLCNKAGPHTKELCLRLTTPDKIKTTDDYFAEVIGDIGDHWAEFPEVKGKTIFPVTLEFGTTQARIPGIDVLGAILNRTLLAEKYGDTHPNKEDIIRKMRTAFTPTQEDWAYAVIAQCHDLWDKFLKL
ncbi:MAG: M14 family metallopeptidase [Pseudobdellovibrionaceae bacterium]|jgi:hypothetical protein|nr:M14 family metallopeptidase [Pseudobdellovibrionaceae bacterium]